MAKVLVVDDSKIARLFTIKEINKLGHEVVAQAEDGEKGFEAYKEFKPDVVLSDIEMPNLDGHGMLIKIKEFDPNAKVVMITSVVNATFIKQIMAQGAMDAIKKPISGGKLEKILERVSS